MDKRLIEVAEEIAKRTEDHMMHKGAEIGGLAFLSSFHAAITILSQIEEFSPEIVVQDDPDFDEVGEALMGGMMPIYAASDAIKEKAAGDDNVNLKPRVDDLSGLAPQTTEGINPRIHPGAGEPDNAGKWHAWPNSAYDAKSPPVKVGDTVYYVGNGSDRFSFGMPYEVKSIAGDFISTSDDLTIFKSAKPDKWSFPSFYEFFRPAV